MARAHDCPAKVIDYLQEKNLCTLRKAFAAMKDTDRCERLGRRAGLGDPAADDGDIEAEYIRLAAFADFLEEYRKRAGPVQEPGAAAVAPSVPVSSDQVEKTLRAEQMKAVKHAEPHVNWTARSLPSDPLWKKAQAFAVAHSYEAIGLQSCLSLMDGPADPTPDLGVAHHSGTLLFR